MIISAKTVVVVGSISLLVISILDIYWTLQERTPLPLNSQFKYLNETR